MMFSDCTIHTPGKWILCGEHAVLRGKDAIVFPLPSVLFTLDYQAIKQPLREAPPVWEESFWRALHLALRLLDIKATSLLGQFHLNNTIPIGGGLGASAALCVTLSRWLVRQGLLSAEQVPTFATELEDLFHGKSSGLDIAGVQSAQGVFIHQRSPQDLLTNWNPHWSISFSGIKGVTAECIQQVAHLHQHAPEQATIIDEAMQSSVSLAREALSANKTKGLPLLIEAMQKAYGCFQQWRLIPKAMEAHIQSLVQLGALAAKPTGSGGGGYVVALWPNPCPSRDDLMPIPFSSSHKELHS
jgi:mevalonate kinase